MPIKFSVSLVRGLRSPGASHLGQYVRQRREAMGLNRGQLAARIGYRNLTKGIRRIMNLESYGACREEFLREVQRILGLDDEQVRLAIRQDRLAEPVSEPSDGNMRCGIIVGNKMLSFLPSAQPEAGEPTEDQLTDPEKGIEVTVDGQHVAGKVKFLHPCEFSLIMTVPYPGLVVSSLHIPWFAAAACRVYAKGGMLTKRGLLTARELLEQAYRAESRRRNLTYLQDTYRIDLNGLRLAYAEVRRTALLDTIHLSDEEFEMRKKALKRLRNAGELAPREYWREEGRLSDQLGLLTPAEYRTETMALRRQFRAGKIDSRTLQKRRHLLWKRYINYSCKGSQVWDEFCRQCGTRWGISEEDLKTFRNDILGRTASEDVW